VQHFTDVNAFYRRQGEIVRAGRGSEVLVAVGGVVAVAFEAFGQQDVAPTVFGQIPQRAQTGRAAAGVKPLSETPKDQRVVGSVSPVRAKPFEINGLGTITVAVVSALVAEARELGVFSVCVSPSMLPLTDDLASLKVATVEEPL